MRKALGRLTLLCLLTVISLMPTLALAHGMILTLEEPGVLSVEYDGGGFSPRTEFVLYDSEGSEVAKGLADKDGRFEFDPGIEVHRAVAEDGMGHRAEYIKGAEEKSLPKVPVVIGVFVLIALIFAVFYKKKN